MEFSGSPKFLGNLISVCTCSKPTPAGLLAPDHKVQLRGPWSSKGRGSHNWVFRRSIYVFGTRCLRFAAPVTRHHARLASSCWSGSTGRAFHPQGSDERFQSCGLHLIPLSQALLGAIDETGASKDTPETGASKANETTRLVGAFLTLGTDV